MSAAAPTDKSSFRHEALIYASDAEFGAVAVPFLRAGIAAGVPSLLGVNPRLERLVRDALDDLHDAPGLPVFLGTEHYAQPFRALQQNLQLITDMVEAGARGVRMIGEVPHPGTGSAWDGWARYEAAINDLYAALPVWSMCPYDTRSTPAHVLADVGRTHPLLAAVDGAHRPNPGYTEPTVFLTERADAEIDPLEQTRPDLELTDPSPASGRHAVTALAATAMLDDDRIDDLVLSVSEALTNAIMHGRPPVQLRAWAAPDRIVVAVRDQGNGPADPYAGYLPGHRNETSAGLGLWLTNQMCSRVTLSNTPDGFTLRLIAGTPPPDPRAPSAGSNAGDANPAGVDEHAAGDV